MLQCFSTLLSTSSGALTAPPFTRLKLLPGSITNSPRNRISFTASPTTTEALVEFFGGNNFQPLKSRDNTPGNAAGF